VECRTWRAALLAANRRCALLALLLGAACRPAGGGLAAASVAASAHLATFARFETWARRVSRSDVALRGELALQEATFAPLHRERSVLWAEVRHERGGPLQFMTPIALDQLAFVTLEAPELGSLRVAFSTSCHAIGRPRKVNACVVIARGSRDPLRPSLRMAFRVEPSG
jgi:hypothetical protein